MTIVNVIQKYSVLIKDMDTVCQTVCCQDPTLAVRNDTERTKCSLGGPLYVKLSFPFFIYLHNCTSSTVENIDIKVSVFTDVLSTIKWIVWLSFGIELNVLNVFWGSVTHNFCWLTKPEGHPIKYSIQREVSILRVWSLSVFVYSSVCS